MAVTSNKADGLCNASFRLCRLCRWVNYTGLGFNLEGTSQPPHLIRRVQSNSPAAAGGVKISDLLLDVNNQDVTKINFKDLTNVLQNAMNSNSYIELLVIQQRFYKSMKRQQVIFDPRLAKIFETPSTMPDDYMNFPKHTPRTCEIRLSATDQSFGFGIIEGENDVGLYIQEVDPNSPADRASLRQCDRILEIDEKFVNNDPSKIIIAKLRKASSKRTLKLYVVDTHTYKYFKENNIPLSSKEYQQSSLAKTVSINSYTNEGESIC
jgi:C-terminal processing protease CtpA/Prc